MSWFLTNEMLDGTYLMILVGILSSVAMLSFCKDFCNIAMESGYKADKYEIIE